VGDLSIFCLEKKRQKNESIYFPKIFEFKKNTNLPLLREHAAQVRKGILNETSRDKFASVKRARR
jgi:hypothetical protein